jgi:hypothetical protein
MALQSWHYRSAAAILRPLSAPVFFYSPGANSLMKSFIRVSLAALGLPTIAACLCTGVGCASDADGLSRTTGSSLDAGPQLSTERGDAGSAEDARAPSGAPTPPDSTNELTLPRCGPPPYQAVIVRARDIQAPPGREQAGVVVTFKQCPGQKFMTGAEGRATILVTQGAETWVCFEAAGYLPWMMGEFAVGPALPAAGLVATMVPKTLAATVVPGYQAEGPMLFVQVQAGRANASEACRLREGVSVGVAGHPNVTVLYRATGSNGSYQRTMGTSAEGVAIMTGLPADATAVDLVAQKMGCNYTLSYGDANSPTLLPILRTPLAKGVITHQSINPAR